MQLGMVGLGKMGANMTRRLMRGGHQLVVSDLSADAVKELAGEGAGGSSSLEDLVGKLKPPGRRGSWCHRAAPPSRRCRNWPAHAIRRRHHRRR
jgi:6-phosphogluconate dehydrogenase (decarboxylating)